MKKIYRSFFLAALFAVACFSSVLADDYIVPVTVDGETVYVTVTVKSGQVVTATAGSDAVVGEIEWLPPVVESVEWADLVDLDPEDFLDEEDEFTGTKFYNTGVDLASAGKIDISSDGEAIYLAPYVGRNPDLTWLRFVVIGSSVVAPSGDIVINILADGQRFSVALMDGDYIANQAGQVNVISQDLKMAEGHIDILKAIAVADSVKFQMRLRGRSVISVATDDQIDHIRNTLAIYAMFGGDIGD